MAIVETEEPGSVSSAEFAVLDADRIAAISKRHQALAELMDAEGFDAILLQRPENLAWFCAGGWPKRGGLTPQGPSLFVTRQSRVLLCQNTDSQEFFDFHLLSLGFQLKERPWFEPRTILDADLIRGRKTASDTGFQGTPDVSLRLQSLRTPLSEYDIARLKIGGKIVSHALEATARGLKPGRVESEIAGELAHRLMKHGAFPERIQILADSRAVRYRHWTYGNTPITKSCALVAIASFQGLSVGASRSVCFGNPANELATGFDQASVVLATGTYFTQTDWELFEVWSRIQRIYEKFDAIDEWRSAEQASVLEYEFGSIPLVSSSEYRLAAGTPLFWRPSAGPSIAADTVLATPEGPRQITRPTNWPTVEIQVKGDTIQTPGLLVL